MTDQTCGVVEKLDAEIIGEENAGYSAAHLKDIRDRVAELIAAVETYKNNSERIKREYARCDEYPRHELDLHMSLKSAMFAALAAVRDGNR